MSLKIKQLLVIVALLGFILFVTNRDHYEDVDIESVRNEAIKLEALEAMEEFGPSEIKKDYGININDYGKAFYYGHEAIMESDKVLFVKLKDGADSSGLISAIRNKNDELKKLFMSYAPDQYEILNNCVLEKKGQYVIYIVSEDALQIYKKIIECIKG